MKKSNMSYVGKVRRASATAFAILVVVGVPLLSINQYGHFFHKDSRKASTLPVFQTRSVDANTRPYHLFEEPLISVTFDDGWEVNYNDAFPLLHKYGVHTTQYIISGVEDNPDYLSWKQIQKIQESGHEIGCHTDTHPDLTLLSDAETKDQLSKCKVKVTKYTGKVTSFASPYGSSDERTLGDISQVFKSQRNTNGDSSNGVTSADVNLADQFNPYNIIGMTVKPDTTPQEIQELVNYAMEHNGWLVLTYHQADDGGTKFGQDPDTLGKQLEVLNRSPVRIVTVDQAINSMRKLEL